jgi:hypothetical protein
VFEYFCVGEIAHVESLVRDSILVDLVVEQVEARYENGYGPDGAHNVNEMSNAKFGSQRVENHVEAVEADCG